MLRDSIIFKNWPKDYRNFNKAYMDTYIRKMKLINRKIAKAVVKLKE